MQIDSLNLKYQTFPPNSTEHSHQKPPFSRSWKGGKMASTIMENTIEGKRKREGKRKKTKKHAEVAKKNRCHCLFKELFRFFFDARIRTNWLCGCHRQTRTKPSTHLNHCVVTGVSRGPVAGEAACPSGIAPPEEVTRSWTPNTKLLKK